MNFLKVFNAFQMVASFVAWPFLIRWLMEARFPGAPVAVLGACAAYVVAFAAAVACVVSTMERFEE